VDALSFRGRPPGSAGWSVGWLCRRAGLLLLGAMLLPIPGAAFTVGAVGGVQRSLVHGDRPEGIQYGRLTGLHLGASGRIEFLGDTLLRLEMSWSRRGTRIGEEIQGQRDPLYNGRLVLDYLSIPLLVEIPSRTRRITTVSGLDLGVLLDATLERDGEPASDVRDQLAGMDLGILFGVGGLLRRRVPTLELELRYSQSVFNLAHGTRASEDIPVRFRTSGLQLLLSVSWQSGGPP